jgi:hypothetical protein
MISSLLGGCVSQLLTRRWVHGNKKYLRHDQAAAGSMAETSPAMP